jgi:taurine dioxygenase
MSRLHSTGSPSFGYSFDSYPVKETYSASESAHLQNMLHEHKLLMFQLELNYDEFENFASQIGELEIAQPVGFNPEGHPHIRLQSNTGTNGMDYAGEYWHSDGPWNTPPSKATLLSCIQAPAQGGETLFIDMEHVYNEMPEEMKQKIANLKGNYPCKQIYLEFMKKKNLPPKEDKLRELQDVVHPLVKEHPVTRKKSLYMNEEWLKGIEGMEQEESDQLLKELYAFVLQEKHIVKYKWQQNDLLIWDNNSLLHNGVRPDPAYPKITKRICIKG